MPDFSPVDYAVPGFVLLVLLEMLWAWKKRPDAYEPRDTLTSLAFGLGSTVAGALTGGLFLLLFLWVWQFRIFDFGAEWWAVWWAWPLCFVLDDLAYYWIHRFGHRVRWFWASHVNHHSSQHYNLSTALRQSWTGQFTGMFVLQIPMVLLGFHPAFVAFVYGFNLVYQFWIHTETIRKMPWWFEAVMNTPSHHRVHHATNPRYLDANYAGTLIIWDRMFGTFVEELEEDMPRYGIVKNIGTFNPIKVAFHEWVGMWKDILQPGISLGDRLRYAYMPPGWSHDGTRKGSEDLKADYVRRNPGQAGMPGLPGEEVLPPRPLPAGE